MNAPVAFNVIPLLESLINAIRPVACAHCIELNFSSYHKEALVFTDAHKLISGFSNLLCSTIHYLPSHKTITVTIKEERAQLIVNTYTHSVDLSRVRIMEGNDAFDVQSVYTGSGTHFRFAISLLKDKEEEKNISFEKRIDFIPDFYAEVRKRLRSHFTKAENLVSLLNNSNPREAQFLQKINGLIEANIDSESFDTLALCKAVNMSRTQLFRRLKPLIRQAPACYIKTFRLQKAKQLLETTNLSVGEVTFKTGFGSQSHFTKVFTRHYGVQPSLFRKRIDGTK